MLKLFFSYSHRDQKLRDELEIHLAMLKREGVINTWHDGRITAGKDLDKNIKEQLEDADIALLLVSPYFLASDYCYNVEMQRAMERHDAGEARVIPIILEHCDWKRSPFGRLRATPTDGKPITKFTNLNEGFSIVTEDVRRAADELLQGRQKRSVARAAPTGKQPARGKAVPEGESRAPRSSNMRIKQTFSDKEKDDFLDETYEYVARFFENSLAELQERNPGTETKFKRIDATHFDASVFRNGKREAYCRIWRGSERTFGGGISYSSSPSAGDNSYNESLDVGDDDYTMGLRPMMGMHRGSEGREFMTAEGASEHLWAMLLENLR